MRYLFVGMFLSLVITGFSQQEEKQKLLEIYGQVMTDAGYNFNQINPDYFDAVRPSQLPSYEDEYGPDGNVWFSVRQSYLGVKGYFPTRLGEMKTIFEFDLYGLGPNGMALCPNIQLRWIPLLGDDRLTFALERPGASVDEGIYRDRVEIKDVKLRLPVPDFSADYRHTCYTIPCRTPWWAPKCNTAAGPTTPTDGEQMW